MTPNFLSTLDYKLNLNVYSQIFELLKCQKFYRTKLVLSEKQRIEILLFLGIEGKMRSQSEVYKTKYPKNLSNSEGTVQEWPAGCFKRQ